jgi:hypothetical protein
MMDFSKIGQIGETVTTGLRDLDSRLESIENLLTTLLVTEAAMVVGTEPSRIAAYVDDMREAASIYRAELTERARAREAARNGASNTT